MTKLDLKIQQTIRSMLLPLLLVLAACTTENSPFDYTIIPLDGCSGQPVLVEQFDTSGRYELWSTNKTVDGWQEYAVNWNDACVMTFELEVPGHRAGLNLFTLDDLSEPQTQNIKISGISISRVVPDTEFSIPRIQRYLDACLSQATSSVCSVQTADWLRANSALLRVNSRRGDTSFTMIEGEAAVTAVLR